MTTFRDDVVTPQRDRSLRADAERNRGRIVQAARRAFATDGLGVSMASIARAAGVGKATLFRHFAAREELITAVFADRMDDYLALTSEALADPDAWHAFTDYVEGVCSMQAADRGFAAVLSTSFPDAKALEDRRAEAYEGVMELIARATTTGHLRKDFGSDDLVILLMANAGVIAATADAAPGSWGRLVGHMLRAFANPGAPLPPMPAAPRSLDLCHDASTSSTAAKAVRAAGIGIGTRRRERAVHGSWSTRQE